MVDGPFFLTYLKDQLKLHSIAQSEFKRSHIHHSGLILNPNEFLLGKDAPFIKIRLSGYENKQIREKDIMITCSKHEVQLLKSRISVAESEEFETENEKPSISILHNSDLEGIVRKDKVKI